MKTAIPFASSIAHRFPKAASSFCLTTLLLLSTSQIVTLPAIAQTPSPLKPKPSNKIRWKPPTPPSSLGIPGNRAQGGGTRGCQPYRGIVALVPTTGQIAWGQTIVDRPRVWLNVPQGLAKGLEIEMVVRSLNGEPIAKQSFTTKTKIAPGAFGVSFPPATSLEIDRPYRWEVAIYCDRQEGVDRPLLVGGQIQRTTAPTQLATTTSPLEIAQILAENGIWYDALGQIGERLSKTKDRQLAATWSDLLKAASIRSSKQIRAWSAID